MQTHPGAARQLQCRSNGDGFSADGNAAKTEARGDFSVVGNAVPGQIMVLWLQMQRDTKCGGVLHGPQQHLRVDQRTLCLGKGNAAGFTQGRNFCLLFAAKALGQRADWIHAREPDSFAAAHNALDEAGLIERRARVGRAGERGDATRDRRREFGFDCTQACRKVDQPRADDAVGGVDHAGSRKAVRCRTDRRDASLGDVKIGTLVETVFRIDDAAADDVDRGVVHVSSQPEDSSRPCVRRYQRSPEEESPIAFRPRLRKQFRRPGSLGLDASRSHRVWPVPTCRT